MPVLMIISRNLFPCAQRDASAEEPEPDDLYNVGSVVMILRMIKMNDGQVKLLVQGLSRAQVEEFDNNGPILLARIRVTQRRLAMIQSDENQESSVFINGQLKIDYTAGCTYLNGTELHLTPIEYKLLCLLSRNVGKVLTHTYITQQIWGSSLENDIASLRVFMATLRKKLEVSQNDIQYIQTHIGIGYRMLKIE